MNSETSQTSLVAVGGESYAALVDSMDALDRLGETIAYSGMFGAKNKEQGRILALQCVTEKKAPLELAKNYHLIDGKLSMRADAMLAGYRQRGGKVQWQQFDDKGAKARWIYDGNDLVLSYTLDDAQKAGAWPAKPGSNWAKFPAAMLRARLISTAVRMLAPEVNCGMYVPEELDTPITVQVETAPAVVAESLIDKLANVIGEKEDAANRFFVALGRIKEGETFRDLPEQTIKNVLANPRPMLAKLNEMPVATMVEVKLAESPVGEVANGGAR
jgi:hypothetical protein